VVDAEERAGGLSEVFFLNMEFERQIQLVLIIACSLAAVASVIMGELRSAAACAFGAFCVSVSYRSSPPVLPPPRQQETTDG
jgi:hypothetical protein